MRGGLDAAWTPSLKDQRRLACSVQDVFYLTVMIKEKGKKTFSGLVSLIGWSMNEADVDEFCFFFLRKLTKGKCYNLFFFPCIKCLIYYLIKNTRLFFLLGKKVATCEISVN